MNPIIKEIQNLIKQLKNDDEARRLPASSFVAGSEKRQDKLTEKEMEELEINIFKKCFELRKIKLSN
jgi:hypothetical protein